MDKRFQQLESIAKDICQKHGAALYDLEVKTTRKGMIVAVFLTKIGGVSVDDCAGVSRELDQELDRIDLFPGSYFLEVSSAGLERPLKLKKHFVSAINELVRVTWKEDEKTHTHDGILEEVREDDIVLKVGEESISVPYKEIRKAKTVFEMKKSKNSQ